ncbi:MAG: FkbM family methyltransferase [Sphingobacteriales bacterium]
MSNIFQKVRHKLLFYIHKPNLPLSATNEKIIKKLGSHYGGWSFVDTPELQGSTIINCGLGEDASFDIGFASKYNAKVIMVDPTPRAVAHYNKFIKRAGQKATTGFVQGGNQPVEAYDMEKLKESNFVMVGKALWTEAKKMKFFSPPNKDYVSHSINNIFNEGSADTDHIEVDSITVEQVMKENNLTSIPLMKVDIEGAEIEVLQDMMAKKIYPKQLLIEFDEYSLPSPKAKERVESTDRALRNAGYEFIHFDRPSNFLYIHKPSFK